MRISLSFNRAFLSIDSILMRYKKWLDEVEERM